MADHPIDPQSAARKRALAEQEAALIALGIVPPNPSTPEPSSPSPMTSSPTTDPPAASPAPAVSVVPEPAPAPVQTNTASPPSVTQKKSAKPASPKAAKPKKGRAGRSEVAISVPTVPAFPPASPPQASATPAPAAPPALREAPTLHGEIWLVGEAPWCQECRIDMDLDKAESVWRCAGCDLEHTENEVWHAYYNEGPDLPPGVIAVPKVPSCPECGQTMEAAEELGDPETGVAPFDGWICTKCDTSIEALDWSPDGGLA